MTFLGVLGLIFITLKLLSVITWSWWLVLLPLYGGLLLAIGVLFLCVVIKGVEEKFFNRKRPKI
jgi:hypothetical protein